MYLHSLRLWNWRKFAEKDNNEAGIEIEFKEGLNILVGENDSGKTAIIDSIKMILGTNSNDMNWITEQDFYKDSKSLKIECIFRNMSEEEEAFFYEWLTIQSEKTELRILLEAEIYEDINRQNKIKRNGVDIVISLDLSIALLISCTFSLFTGISFFSNVSIICFACERLPKTSLSCSSDKSSLYPDTTVPALAISALI